MPKAQTVMSTVDVLLVERDLVIMIPLFLVAVDDDDVDDGKKWMPFCCFWCFIFIIRVDNTLHWKDSQTRRDGDEETPRDWLPTIIVVIRGEKNEKVVKDSF